MILRERKGGRGSTYREVSSISKYIYMQRNVL